MRKLKRSLIAQLGTIVALPILLLAYVAYDIGRLAGEIRTAVDTEHKVISVQNNYKTFVDGVVDAVDTGKLSEDSFSALVAVDTSLHELRAMAIGSALGDLSSEVKKQAAFLRSDRQLATLIPLQAGINTTSQMLKKESRILTDQTRAEIESLVNATALWRVLIGALVVTIIAIAALFLAHLLRRLTTPLEGAIRVCASISEGELAVDAWKTTGQRDVGGLVLAIDRMRNKWVDVVTGLRGQTTIMHTATASLDLQVVDLEDTARQQADAAASIAASLQQLAASIASTAERAANAREQAESAGHNTLESIDSVRNISVEIEGMAGVVRDAASQVELLGAKAGEIGGVVSTIKEISDQTNLLALNAAIEAARAGEQGRGFAVVAEEVRKLADRTGKSTQAIGLQIADMQGAIQRIVDVIASAVARVHGSVNAGRQAVSGMEAINDMARAVAELVTEVDRELQEQRLATNQIDLKARRVSELANTNVDTGQQVAISARSVGQSAIAITGDLSFFKVAQKSEAIESILF